MDKDEAAALWATAHSDAGRPDPAVELAELEATVYSRAGSAESVVDFVDPATGDTVRATPSQLRLRVLRAAQAERAERVDSTTGGGADRFARLPDPDSLAVAMPALPIASTDGARRRFVLPLVAVVAFAAGLVVALLVSPIPGSIAGPGTPIASERPDLVVLGPLSTPEVAPQPTLLGPPPTPVATPLPTSLEPPSTPGDTVLLTGSSDNGDFQAAFDAHGQGLSFALHCVGDGTVTIDLNDGESLQFNCTSGSVVSHQMGVANAYGACTVTVFAPDSVVWGLTIASGPVSEPAEG